MATTKLMISLDAAIAREARQVVGARDLSQLVEVLLRLHLQGIRLRMAEDELTAKYGPIPDDVKRRVAALDWPE